MSFRRYAGLLIVLAALLAGCQPGGKVATPTFTPEPGQLYGAQSVAISTTTGEATIRFTVDGSTPTFAEGTLYAGPLTITESTTIKAIAYAPGYQDSAVAEGVFLIGATAEELVTAAYEAMDSGDWETALDDFGQAVLQDPDNGDAVIGYAVLNVAAILADQAVVDMAHDKLGLVDYPSEMSTILSPEWLASVPQYSGSEYTMLVPNVSGQEDWADLDGDATFVSPAERLVAFLAFVAANNPTGLNAIVESLGGAISARLDLAIDAINAASDTMTMTLTWETVTQEATMPDWWPLDSADEPVSFVVGKAEALALASVLSSLRTMVEIAQAYDLSVPFKDYWESFNPFDGSGTNPDDADKPFSGSFLELSSDAAAHLTAAKEAYLEAAELVMAAADGMAADREGFTISSGTDWMFQDTESWGYFLDEVALGRRAAQELYESVSEPRMALFPLGFESAEAWPTTFDPGTCIEVNLYAFFNTTTGLASAMLEIEPSPATDGPNAGEPVFYALSGGAMAKVTYADIDAYAGGTYDYDFSANDTEYYFKVPDITYDGVFPVANIPVDDPTTRYAFLDVSYDDADFSGYWDAGEEILAASSYASLEGPISLDDLGDYGGDPLAWYTDVAGLSDDLLDSYLLDPAADRETFRAAIAASGEWDPSVYLSFLGGSSYYLGELGIGTIWHSYTTEGEVALFSGADVGTSAGSFWWAYADSIY